MIKKISTICNILQQDSLIFTHSNNVLKVDQSTVFTNFQFFLILCDKKYSVNQYTFLYIRYHGKQSSKRKIEFTGPNQILEFIFIYI